MSIIKTILVAPRRFYHKRQTLRQSAAQGPILVSAVADFSETSITLTFDRPIEMVSYDPSQIIASSALDQLYYQGNGTFDPPAGNTIKLYMGPTDEYTGDANLLNAGNASGIRAVEDDVAWVGVADFVIGV